MRVIDIRGTHGSGKSFVPHTLLNMYMNEEVWGEPLTYEGKNQVLGYYIRALNLYIVGKYESACGGCDGVKTQAEIKARITHFLELGNVLIEGILVSHTFGPWDEFARGKDWRFLFLDTPEPLCIARVQSRRFAKGNDKPLNDANIKKDWKRIRSLLPKFQAAGHSAQWVDHEGSVSAVLEALNESANA